MHCSRSRKTFQRSVFELDAENADSGVQIDRKTCIPNWGGESMDLDVVVEGLLRRQD